MNLDVAFHRLEIRDISLLVLAERGRKVIHIGEDERRVDSVSFIESREGDSSNYLQKSKESVRVE